MRISYGTLAAIAVIGSGCVSMAPGNSAPPGGVPHDRALSSITVPLHARGEEALHRMREAATRGGWRLAAAAPGLVMLGPVTHREEPRVRLMIVVFTDGDSATVRGAITDPTRGLRDHPVRRGTKGRAAWRWRELSRFADALRHQ